MSLIGWPKGVSRYSERERPPAVGAPRGGRSDLGPALARRHGKDAILGEPTVDALLSVAARPLDEASRV
jgi:hypothetical protein